MIKTKVAFWRAVFSSQTELFENF